MSPRSATVAESDVLAAIWAGDGLASTSAVASALDITRETARAHLDTLQAAGTLELMTDDPGNVWRLPDRGE